MRRVLIIRFSSLGDILLTFPSVDYLLQHEKCEVHYLTKESFKELLQMNDGITCVHTISDHASFRELYQKIQELKQLQFTDVYDLHRNIRSFFATKFLGRPFRRVRKFRFKEFFLYLLHRGLMSAFKIAPINRSIEAFQVVSQLDSLHAKEAISFNNGSERQTLHLQDFDGKSMFPKGFVSICMESAWKQKQWPAERFIEVAKHLVTTGYGVVWLGLEPIVSEGLFEGTVDLTQQLSIRQVASVLQDSKLLICNDSGLMHLAETVNTPVVSIFGPTSVELGFGPRLSKSRVVESNLWCRPCSKTGRWCFRPVNRRMCLKQVDTHSVLQTVNEVVTVSGRGLL